MPKGQATTGDALSDAGIPPLPPGVFLAENLLPALKLTLEEASGRTGMPIATMLKIVRQKKAVTVGCANKLAELHKDFDSHFWLGLQATVDGAAAVASAEKSSHRSVA